MTERVHPDVAEFPVPPIVRQTRVSMRPPETFRRFTEEIADWWPLRSLSVFREQSSTCFLEPFVGGRLVEVAADGETSAWAIVEEWQPPSKLALKWHAGRPEEQAQRVSLTFMASGEEGTIVTLVHSGWEALGAEAEAVRGLYESGWRQVLSAAFGGVTIDGEDDRT